MHLPCIVICNFNLRQYCAAVTTTVDVAKMFCLLAVTAAPAFFAAVTVANFPCCMFLFAFDN